MNDKKQIEEMASLMADCNTTCDECFERLERVMTMKIKEREKHCQAYMYAKRAVEQGYRKISEDSVVITKEELKKIIQEEYQNALKDKVVLTREEYDKDYVTREHYDYVANKYDALVVRMKKIKEEYKALKDQAHKETAREIFQWLKEHTIDSSFAIIETYFKEQYEVEIGEQPCS